jgi:hypothetical protein
MPKRMSDTKERDYAQELAVLREFLANVPNYHKTYDEVLACKDSMPADSLLARNTIGVTGTSSNLHNVAESIRQDVQGGKHWGELSIDPATSMATYYVFYTGSVPLSDVLEGKKENKKFAAVVRQAVQQCGLPKGLQVRIWHHSQECKDLPLHLEATDNPVFPRDILDKKDWTDALAKELAGNRALVSELRRAKERAVIRVRVQEERDAKTKEATGLYMSFFVHSDAPVIKPAAPAAASAESKGV